MRQLPVFSDGYWLLKARRKELRAKAPTGWLETMGYGTDCPPTFAHGVPDGAGSLADRVADQTGAGAAGRDRNIFIGCSFDHRACVLSAGWKSDPERIDLIDRRVSGVKLAG